MTSGLFNSPLHFEIGRFVLKYYINVLATGRSKASEVAKNTHWIFYIGGGRPKRLLRPI